MEQPRAGFETRLLFVDCLMAWSSPVWPSLGPSALGGAHCGNILVEPRVIAWLPCPARPLPPLPPLLQPCRRHRCSRNHCQHSVALLSFGLLVPSRAPRGVTPRGRGSPPGVFRKSPMASQGPPGISEGCQGRLKGGFKDFPGGFRGTPGASMGFQGCQLATGPPRSFQRSPSGFRSPKGPAKASQRAPRYLLTVSKGHQGLSSLFEESPGVSSDFHGWPKGLLGALRSFQVRPHASPARRPTGGPWGLPCP